MTTVMQRLPRDLPAPSNVANVITRLLLTAASQIGYREGRDPDGDWNNDNAFGLYFKQNGVSWCHWFASWAAVAAEIPDTVIPRTGYTPTGWNWFTSRDRDVTTPKAGDFFYVYGYVPAEDRSRVHHVGIVEKVLSDGRIQTIEGNTNTSGSSQGNGVYRLIRTVSSKLRFARPDYQLAVQAPKPPTGDTAKPPTQPPAPSTPTPTPTPTQEGELTMAAQFDDIMTKLGQIETNAANRYSDLARKANALMSQEAGRYKYYADRFAAILQAVAADDANDVTPAHVDLILAKLDELKPAEPETPVTTATQEN